MKISYAHLRRFIDFDLSSDQLAELLTSIGLEVESIHNVVNKNDLSLFRVGYVESFEKHPNAVKLNIAQVRYDIDKIATIVCGAPNLRSNIKVAVAPIGTFIHTIDDNSFEIKQAKIRGIDSYGMLCSYSELGIRLDNSGIAILDHELEIGKPLSEVFPKIEDCIYDIGLTANRNDALYHRGVALDLLAACHTRKIPIKWIESQFTPPVQTLENKIKVSIDTEKCMAYYGFSAVFGQPKWDKVEELATSLSLLGVRSIHPLVDIVNYATLLYGQPFHCFDLDRLSSESIRITAAQKQEQMNSLDNSELHIMPGDILVLNDAKIVALAGIIGAHESGVLPNTQEIFIESALFDDVQIRKTAQRIGIKTDASNRFEKGIDPSRIYQNTQIIQALIAEVYPNAKFSEIQTFAPANYQPKEVLIPIKKVALYAGYPISVDQLIDILTNLQFSIVSQDSNSVTVATHPAKFDVLRSEDIIEEILRIKGFHEIPIPSTVKSSLTFLPSRNFHDFTEFMSSLMVGMGYFETMSTSISKSIYYDNPVMLMNSMNSYLDCLRENLYFGLLEAVSYNLNRSVEDFKGFEIGKTYHKTSEGYEERNVMSWVSHGFKVPKFWRNAKPDVVSFFDIKESMDAILSRWSLDIDYREVQDENFNSCLDIYIKEKNIGRIGEFNTSILEKVALDSNVVYGQLNLDYIWDFIQNHKLRFEEMPKFQPVKRDLAFLVDIEVLYQDIVSYINDLKISQIKKISLLDFYESNKLPQGKKSYALRFHLVDEHKTMEEKDIDAIIQKIIHQLVSKCHIEIRS
ncbi:MAG: phenylalanine--tRNA ligase subunit beta [Chitinophagales bacterium]|nr:phenylalanine--tRNA ligase subunit beta [Chitinophagales bacterium]